MTAVTLNLPPIEIGPTYVETIYWKDGSKKAIDMTDCTVQMQIRATVDSPILICELNSTTNSRIILTEVLGKIDLIIPSNITQLLKPLNAVYALWVTFPNGYVISLIEGPISIKPGVIHA